MAKKIDKDKPIQLSKGGGKLLKLPTGMRAFKTALAVVASIIVCRILKLPQETSAAIAAVICMQTYVYDTVEEGIHRMFSTILGGVIAVAFHLLNLVNLYTIFLGSLAVGLICIKTNWIKAIVNGNITFIIVMLNTADPKGLTLYTAHVFVATGVGLVASMVINAVVWPLHAEKLLVGDYVKTYEQLIIALGNIVCGKKIDTLGLTQHLNTMNNRYLAIRKGKKINMATVRNFETIQELNYKFYIASSILAELSHNKDRPELDGYNKDQLSELLKEDVIAQIKETEGLLSRSSYVSYNYSLGRLFSVLAEIKTAVEHYDKYVAKHL